MTKFAKTWQLLYDHKLPLTQLIVLIYGPFYLAYVAAVAGHWLPEDAADKLFGLIAILLMPIINGSVVWLVQRWYDGEKPRVGQALAAISSYWSRLLTVYISISFILVGWFAMTVLPAYVLMMILKLTQPLYLVPIGAVTAVWVLSQYAFVDPLIVSAGLGPWQARQRSAELVKGRRKQVIGWGLLTYSLPFLLEAGGEAASEFLPEAQQSLSLGIGTTTGILAAILYIVPAVFFYVYYRELGGAAGPEQPVPSGVHAT